MTAAFAAWANSSEISDLLELVIGAIAGGLIMASIAAYFLQRWRG